jgi:adenosylcobinamide-GDP ribazoletransferase
MRERVLAWAWAPIIALQFLTRIPVRGVPDWAYSEKAGRGKSFVFYPLVGALVGCIGAAVMLAAHAIKISVGVGAILTIASTAAITGALHEDGFADVADGLGPHEREAALRAMRDSRIGSFGTIALWVLLSLKYVALTSLAPGYVVKAIIAAHVLARWSSLPMSIALPYAQSTPGLGAGLASTLTGRIVIAATLLAAGLVFGLLGPLTAVKCTIAAIAAMIVTGLFYRLKFGGVTGDCLGATNQIVEVAILFVATM